MNSFDLIKQSCAAVGLNHFLHGLQILSADEFARQHFPRLDPNQPALIVPLSSRELARECKRALLLAYPPTHSLTLIQRDRAEPLTLDYLDRVAPLTNQTALYIPPLERAGSFYALAEIVAHLRAPEGCPWDREQTHASLAPALIEEAYEVVDAIERGDLPHSRCFQHLREELGDLLLHVLMQTQIAQDAGEFQLSDVIAEIAEKLVRRHPHVFGGVPVNGTDEILENWERIKAEERKGKKKSGALPRAMPALMRAQKIAEKRKTKVDLKAVAARVEKLAHAKNPEQALGEVLFVLAAYAAEQKVDAEGAVRGVATRKELSHGLPI